MALLNKQDNIRYMNIIQSGNMHDMFDFGITMGNKGLEQELKAEQERSAILAKELKK